MYNRSTAQAIVDEFEEYSFFLEDSNGSELFFTTNTGTVDDAYLDTAYDVASMYAAVKVYPEFHLGQDMLVVQILD